jgi:hypothetical protein
MGAEMTCDVQSLLDDARCFHAAPPRLQGALLAALWCSAAEAVAGAQVDHVALQSDDGLWYQLRASSGGGTLQIGPVTATPGANAYLVLVDLDDGLKYKFELFGTGVNVEWQISGLSVEAETPTTVYSGAVPYTLSTVESGTTIELNP